MPKRQPTLDDLLLKDGRPYDVIAAKAGIARRTIYGARSGRMPRRGTIVKLAKALAVEPGFLMAAIEASRAAGK